MEVLTTSDYNEIANSDAIESTIAGMLSVLEDSSKKHNELENQNWYQRMICTVLGKNKATVKEIKENHNKFDKYIAETITELYNQDMISNQYLVLLGNRINEVSSNDALLKKNLIELTKKIDEKINSIEFFNKLVFSIEYGLYDHAPKLITLINIVNSCYERIINDKECMDILKPVLIKKHFLSDEEIDFGKEYSNISNLNSNELSVLEIQLARTTNDDLLNKLYSNLSMLISNNLLYQEEILDSNVPAVSYTELFERLVIAQREYYIQLKEKAIETNQVIEEEHDNVKQLIDKSNCVGVYDESIIPLIDEILPKYEINNTITLSEETIIEGKDVYVNNTITTKAYLEFTGCIIHINNTIEGRIFVTDAKTLIFNDCLIVGNKDYPRPFVHLEDGYFTCRNSILDNVAFLLEEINSINISTEVPIVEFENCHFRKVGSSFYEEKFHESRYRGTDDIHLSMKNCYFEIDKKYLLPEKPIIYMYADGAIFENCIFKGNCTVDDYNLNSELKLISGDTIIYNNVKVSNLAGIAYFSKINGMNIKDCISFKLDSLYHKEYVVEYITVEDCFDFELDFSGPGAIINNSQFRNLCFNEESFMNTVMRMERESKSDQRNTIMNSTFKNIKLAKFGHIISCHSEIQGSVIVSNCLFENIQCEKKEIFSSIGKMHLFVDKDVDVFRIENTKLL